MSRIWKVWLDSPLNDATERYIQLIEAAIFQAGDSVVRVSLLSEISSHDWVVSLHAKATCQVKLKCPKAKVLTWFQGIVPEEAMLWKGKPLPNWVYKFVWEVFERVALKLSCITLYVSEAMARHYYLKYGHVSNNNIIIPCFNSELKFEDFDYPHKYDNPTFVYAGGVDEWQCIDEMLALYAVIEDNVHNSQLTILTSQQNVAKDKVRQFSLKNVKVSYVELNQLSNELAKYKYGFMLRKDDPINRVATPTKMNSYMASGLIPIFADVIGDFKKVMATMDYRILVDDIDDEKKFLDVLISFEEKELKPDEVRRQFKCIFDQYYSFDYHVGKLKNMLMGV